MEQTIAERAVTVLSSREGVLPDPIQQGDRVVIVAAKQEPNTSPWIKVLLGQLKADGMLPVLTD
ncbi:hypothetical protein J7E78_19405 [Paenibacillus polymyxa]|uniref:hypothetical protein n=1 Tax=Paenibacillus polymyxa TaxID=1406 RepID=UPI001BE6808B|nr:hypothetical protein [Paenibacillus polymyxa]MBT2285714.1 hypothetical protein [Paenibacillus polymyxa]